MGYGLVRSLVAGLREEELQLVVGVVDHKLLEAVDREDLPRGYNIYMCVYIW